MQVWCEHLDNFLLCAAEKHGPGSIQHRLCGTQPGVPLKSRQQLNGPADVAVAGSVNVKHSDFVERLVSLKRARLKTLRSKCKDLLDSEKYGWIKNRAFERLHDYILKSSAETCPNCRLYLEMLECSMWFADPNTVVKFSANGLADKNTARASVVILKHATQPLGLVGVLKFAVAWDSIALAKLGMLPFPTCLTIMQNFAALDLSSQEQMAKLKITSFSEAGAKKHSKPASPAPQQATTCGGWNVVFMLDDVGTVQETETTAYNLMKTFFFTSTHWEATDTPKYVSTLTEESTNTTFLCRGCTTAEFEKLETVLRAAFSPKAFYKNKTLFVPDPQLNVVQ